MPEPEQITPVWCIAANMVYERDYGPGGQEKRSGTRHFAPGAKLYIVDFFWGMAGENCTVVGHHRKSRRYITIVTQSKWLANWRVELVYSPYVIKEVVKHTTYKPPNVTIFGLWTLPEDPDWASSKAAKERAEEIVSAFNMPGRRAPDQPPVTRPPTL